ncbi:MAG: farnesyl diphosphate synthase [Opitutae bacterium]
MNFSEKLKSFQDRIEKHLRSDLPESSNRPVRLHEAMNYSLQAGGKRLRPVLVLAASNLFPGKNDPMPAALAVEMIHTYSLIHDDLPAMDDSDLRRGVPTCHRAFDEATAILAGDALIPLAFELLAKSYAQQPDLGLQLVCMLAETAGSQKLVGGQMEDLLAEGKSPDEQTLSFVHANKTAAMIEVSLAMGFLLGSRGTDQELLKLVSQAGQSLGLAFQAVDDLLDVTSTTEALGKDAAHDKEAGKMTWVKMYGLEKARELASEHTEKALQKIGDIGGDNQFLLELAEYMLRRKN